ncbi:ATP-binding protein [Streptomyces sp. NPDC021020]|uniref:ATP-binding protein n=1 Tax=Streptomyces sp. NPDC021020 TaxID=3365109 RepID=UPI00379B2EBF
MSLPLTRRIARAALLLGAAAVPLIGAGAAHAAAPEHSGVGGLTAVDGAELGSTVGHASQATDAAGRVVGATTESLPVAGALPDTGTLPTDELPLRALPMG